LGDTLPGPVPVGWSLECRRSAAAGGTVGIIRTSVRHGESVQLNTTAEGTRIPARSTVGLRRAQALLILGPALVVIMIAAIGIGAVEISPAQVISIILSWFGLEPIAEYSEIQLRVLQAIRLPRVVLGALVGGALAVSGAAMQGLFRNPLADPGLLGISSGASLAAAASIVLNFGLFG